MNMFPDPNTTIGITGTGKADGFGAGMLGGDIETEKEKKLKMSAFLVPNPEQQVAFNPSSGGHGDGGVQFNHGGFEANV